MNTDKLQQRQQTLINLITRVGGKQNIQKWLDELLQIDWKLETEVNKMETSKKPQAKLNNELETAKKQLLALGVLEESILIENGIVQVLGADTQKADSKTFYWDAKVFPFDEDNGNVHINPNQIKNSQQKAYQNYKASLGNKPCKSFQKWLEPQLANLPQIETVVNKIDAKPASIWIKEELYSYVLVVNRSSRHVQELSAAIRHELSGSDYQDKAMMIFLNKQETISLAKKDEWKLTSHATLMKKEGDREKQIYIKDEVFAPILEKINLAAAKCGDSFKMPFGFRVM